MRNVWVIGGGISGLACAWRLRQMGVSVRLLERSGIAGGVIRTERRNDFLFDAGPQSFLLTDSLRDLIRELGLQGELVLADSKIPRYILRGGRLLAVPMAPPAFLRSSLLSWGSKARLLSEPFRGSRKTSPEESVAAFVRRRFGGEILDYLVAPFVSGVFAGDPETLSMASAFPSAVKWEQEYNSVLRGAIKFRKSSGPRPPLASFRNGMASLPLRLAERMGDSLEMESSRSADVVSSTLAVSGGDAVVLATSAYSAAELLQVSAGRVAELLGGIAYAPLAVVAMAFDQHQVGRPLDGFGFLAPRREGLTILGTVWNSALFPHRAPPGKVLITSFIGGATNLGVTALSEDQLLDIAVRENSHILEISGPPLDSAVFRYACALPQYSLGHAERLRNLAGELDLIPGLFLTGNYWAGPSIGDCLEHAFAAAERVNAFLQK